MGPTIEGHRDGRRRGLSVRGLRRGEQGPEMSSRLQILQRLVVAVIASLDLGRWMRILASL